MTRDYFADLKLVSGNPRPTRKTTEPVGDTNPYGLTQPPRAVADGGKYADKALSDELETVAAAPVGRRNQTLNRAAFNLYQLTAQGYLDEEEVTHQLTQVGLATGLPEKEVANTLQSALEAAPQKPRRLPPPPAGGSLNGHPKGPQMGDDNSGAAHGGPGGDSDTQSDSDLDTDSDTNPDTESGPLLNAILPWHELFAADAVDEEWIINPLLPARRMVALYSAPKVGKSLLMLELAVAIATGGRALGGTIPAPHRVLYVDFENDPMGDIRTRLEAMGYGPDDLENLCYLSFPRLAKFDTFQGGADLLRHAQHYECDVIVIDTISRGIAGEENDNDTWLSFHRHTGLALKQNGIACIRLDHSGKDKEKGMRGGSAKYGDVDAVWKLDKITEATLSLECTDHRMPLDTQQLTLVRDPWPVMRHRLLTEDPRTLAAEERVRALIELLDRLHMPENASNQAAIQRLQEAGDGARAADVRQAQNLRRLRLTEDTPDDPEDPLFSDPTTDPDAEENQT